MSHDGLWRPYFNRYRASNVGERHAKRRVSASKQRNRSPHRILAHPSVPPTLLLASSISTSGRKPNPVANSEQSMVCEDEPRWNATTSRDLPPGNRNALQQDDANAHPFIQENHKPAPSDPWIMQNHAFQRSSFSQGTEHSNPSPMVFSGQSKSERLNGTSIRMRRRGNITDPEIFRRPRTSSQVELGVYFDRINQAPEDFAPKPRLRHHPSFTDLRFEALCLAAADSDSVFDIKLPARDTPSPNSPGVERIVHSSGNQRHSAAASDPASTLVGSDNDIKVFSSGEDDDTDFQSDIAFDSFPSRAPVHSKTNRRGPRIETIFDQSIPITSPKLVSLSSERYPSRIDSTSNEPESYDQDFAEFSDETWHLCDIHSSPPQLKLPTHEAFEEDSWSSSSRNPSAHRLLSKLQTSSTPQPRTGDLSSLAHQRASDLESPRTNINSNPAPSASRTSAPRPHSSVTLHENLEKSSRLCLYDWSEQQSVKKDDQGFEARPRTSHIEQFLDLRGGRTALRRTSSSLHLRSQSVPIPRDPSTQMEANTAKKFATWGLGNKGASEDWDGDFDFGDNDRPLQTNSTSTEKHDDKIDGNQTVRVPKAIMDRQESVYGQYSHVQELTVLVEELKLLRARARAMQIIDGPSSELWKEAQGIISLATFEEDEEQEHELRLKRSTSSLTFSLDEFEVDGVCDRRTSGLADTLALNDDQFHPPEATYPSRSGRPSRRARTESSTKAKYVLDSIHRERRLREDGNVRVGSDGQQKLAFDTQSLRDLVIRAGVVTRALKDAVRKAEGVCIDPETNNPTPDPPFSRIFTQPQGELIATGIRS